MSTLLLAHTHTQAVGMLINSTCAIRFVFCVLEYGTVDGLWFDGNWARQDRDWQEDQLYGLIRELRPNCIIVNNSSIGAVGAEVTR